MLYYDYYKGWCVCNGREAYIGMRDLAGNETSRFPVQVYNVDEESIGTANNKTEYIAIWNSDPKNFAIGVISGLVGPFLFTLTIRPGQTAPAYVIGVVVGVIEGIFSPVFSPEFA